MTEIKSISIALDPTNVPSFLLDWEITKLCNLDCSYCETGIEFGSHDNSTQHPPLDECLRTIDFMFEYVDLYMSYKKPTHRKVIINLYGGESLFHPDIVEILQAVRSKYEAYKDRWYLTVMCTTNGIVGETQWGKIVPLIDNFTLSYHTENLPKQKEIFKRNVLALKSINKPFRTVVMMHNDQTLWQDSVSMTEFLKQHDIPYTAKPLDNTDVKWSYTADQFRQLKTFWINKVTPGRRDNYKNLVENVGGCSDTNSIQEGRACCGNRKLSINGDLKSSITFVPKQGFTDWYCSVNWFFLFVQQLTGNVYTNKDCRMSTTGRVEPLGNLNNYQSMIDTLRTQLESKQMPIIQCKKDVCLCGFCAPKAEQLEDFKKLIKFNVPEDIFRVS